MQDHLEADCLLASRRGQLHRMFHAGQKIAGFAAAAPLSLLPGVLLLPGYEGAVTFHRFAIALGGLAWLHAGRRQSIWLFCVPRRIGLPGLVAR